MMLFVVEVKELWLSIIRTSKMRSTHTGTAMT